MEPLKDINGQIVEEASFWFVECRGGDLNESGRLEFDAWLRRSPEHLRAYLEVAAIWSEGPGLDPANKWDTETLIAMAAEHPDNVVALNPYTSGDAAPTSSGRAKVHKERAGEYRYSRLPRRRVFVLAASVAGLLAAVAMWIWLPTAAPVYTTGVGEQRVLKLADASTVQLNSRSRIRVRYSGDQREVDLLAGQALFHVAKDSSRPFVVDTGTTRVRAVGTQFDVYKKALSTVVTVVEGRVSVLAQTGISGASTQGQSDSPSRSTGSSASTTIAVSAGEQLIVTSEVAQLAEQANIAAATAWTQRQIVFDSATLAEVAEELNRYNSRQIIIDAPDSYQFHISGVFSSTDPESFIRFMRIRPDISVTETSAEIRIARKQ